MRIENETDDVTSVIQKFKNVEEIEWGDGRFLSRKKKIFVSLVIIFSR